MLFLVAPFVKVQNARLSDDSVFTSCFPLGGRLPNGPHCVLLLMGRLVLVQQWRRRRRRGPVWQYSVTPTLHPKDPALPTHL